MRAGPNWKPRSKAADLKLVRLLILLLIGLSWATTLAEGVRCEETDHHVTEWISDGDTGTHESRHPCLAGFCHFGHCGHLVLRLQSTPQDQPAGFIYRGRTPYAFALPSEPLSLPMRPPLAV